ncbi:MAG: hypothetical protein HOQ22_17420 [Nocardioidaceae bacterium]|nr:hypothetical protein [Nocardioidaceae bacterium]
MSARAVAALLVLLAALTGCEAATGPPPEKAAVVMPIPPGDPYATLARQLQQRGVRVWFEADLVERWLAGPTAFAQGVRRVRRLAALPGVAGVKIADELGYGDGLGTPARVLAFLRDSRAALGRHTRVLVDVLVPELGCLAWTGQGSASCGEQARRDYPAATEQAVTGYLRSGTVDAVDLSTGLLDPATYAGWGLSPAQAQRTAWTRVRELGWDRLTSLRSRKALAAPGGYRGDPRQAAADVATYVSVPVAAGARSVDIWTWRQPYDGRTVSLLAGGLTPNPLWVELRAARRHGAVLFTHMTPSRLPTGRRRAAELRRAAEVFSAVFVAAGTG